MRKNLKVGLFVLLAVLLASLAGTALAAPPEQTDSQKSIVDLAVENGQFTTLVAALEQTGLVDRLKGEGPFTIFAPTDEAFARLPEGTLEDLFANEQALTDLLLYHVVDGKLAAADVIQQESFEALTGQALTITTEAENVMVNGANVLTLDLAGSNGVIHVIDTVLTPPTGEIVIAGDETATDDSTTTPGGTTPAQSPVAAGCAENYVVQASDTLSLIADKYLGDPQAFSQIVEATNTVAADNQTFAMIDDPNLIEVGQTICIPGSAETQTTPATTPDDATAASVPTGSTAQADDEQMMAIPEGKAKLVFRNFSFVDLVFDVNGPTAESLVIVPDGKNEFILEPGAYNYNAHQPGGDFSVAPGSFELAAGETLVLSCSDSPVCLMEEMEANAAETPASSTS